VAVEQFMTELLKQALERASKWAPERQDDAARLLLLMGQLDHTDHQLSPEQQAGVREALSEAARGEYASDQEMAALWTKCGL
jgi:hypothetical protein